MLVLTIVHSVVVTTGGGNVVGLRRVTGTIVVGQGNTLAGQPLLVGVVGSVDVVLLHYEQLR